MSHNYKKDITLQNPNLYQLGTDEIQSPELFVTSSYLDGIYNEMTTPGFKDLNKRVLNVPQSEWTAVVSGEEIFSKDYATATVTASNTQEFPETEEPETEEP